MRSKLSLLLFASLSAFVNAEVTVYTSSTDSAAAAHYTVASTDQTILQAPAPPGDFNPAFFVQLYDGGMTGMSNPVGGALLGFSIELSVAAMLMGEKPAVIRPEFLNYCALLEARGGSVTIRVGGNTQDKATLNMDGNPNGHTIQKYKGNDASKTETPEVHFTPDLLLTMAEISKLVNANWFFGIPFVNNNADGNAALVLQNAKSTLGKNLLGLQMANEPDLYSMNQKKSSDYDIPAFMADTTYMINNLTIQDPILAGPSPCCFWSIGQLLDAGYLTQFQPQLKYIDVMHYPDNNCAQPKVDPQTKYTRYVSHHEVQNLVAPYLEASNAAVAAGKQFMMMETNTASCGGFPGISDGFASALWATDYALQMAYGNFTYGLIHFGGQNVYYNPFTPPPTNMTKVRQWNTGAIFYAQLIAAEALGKTGNARVIDLYVDNNSDSRAGYAIYENGVATRLLFVNYVQPTVPNANDYIVTFAVGGGQTNLPAITPATVKVKYLRADSINSKDNITWAGQTFGAQFQSDGRLQGDLDVVEILCNAADGTCNVPVPGPSVALVFLSDAAMASSGADITQAETFATTVTTGKAVPSMDQAALMSSNGRSGGDPLGTTSKSSSKDSSATLRSTVGSAWIWGVSVSVSFALAKLLL
ncbi:glycoside hydrolase family 79 protein [Tulasnella calospora MUT 4182]|uniref:Glycoside hydrolase family 79 protein n=1 Tax=Tulasnella calospora MUT 4182 TaxID=1051891 RepID=A0A0C3MBU7_9AGAM|nr:glycoside hydrolase family 79 protein [Tulasnella calospora MUT 4182]